MGMDPDPALEAIDCEVLEHNKKLYNHQIAALFGINQGRVSEVLTGKTYPTVPPAQGSLFDG